MHSVPESGRCTGGMWVSGAAPTRQLSLPVIARRRGGDNRGPRLALRQSKCQILRITDKCTKIFYLFIFIYYLFIFCASILQLSLRLNQRSTFVSRIRHASSHSTTVMEHHMNVIYTESTVPS